MYLNVGYFQDQTVLLRGRALLNVSRCQRKKAEQPSRGLLDPAQAVAQPRSLGIRCDLIIGILVVLVYAI